MKLVQTVDVPDLLDVIKRKGRPTYLLQREGSLEMAEQIMADENLIYYPPTKIMWPTATEEAVELIKKDDNQSLFRDLIKFIHRHLELPEPDQEVILALWVMMTWVFKKFDKLPFLFFFGPPATGKTRGHEVLREVCWRGVHSVVASEASIFRMAEYFKPTLLVDEATLWDRERMPGLISLLNARHAKDVLVPRVNKEKIGAASIQAYEVFGPTCLAGTDDLTATLRTRSIVLYMKGLTRRVRRHLDKKEGEHLRNRLLAFKIRHLNDDFRGSEEELAVLKESRHEDLFTPLFVIAERVDWNGPERSATSPFMSNTLQQRNGFTAPSAAKQHKHQRTPIWGETTDEKEGSSGFRCLPLGLGGGGDIPPNTGNIADYTETRQSPLMSNITETVMKFAISYERRALEERKAGREAELIRILVDLSHLVDKEGAHPWLPISSVADEWNERNPPGAKGRPKRPHTIGRWLGALDFKKEVRGKRVGVVYDFKILKLWARRYGVPLGKLVLEREVISKVYRQMESAKTSEQISGQLNMALPQVEECLKELFEAGLVERLPIEGGHIWRQTLNG